MKPWLAVATAFLVSLAILICATVAWGPYKELDQDAPAYLAIAQSLAAGHGFKNPISAWPDRGAYDRMPGWPAIVALALWTAPGARPQAVIRFADAVCLALAAAFFAGLSQRLGVRPMLSILAGLGVSVSPPLVAISVTGMSEVCFVMFVGMGLLGIFAGDQWLYAGAVALGVAPLVRPNFILVPAAFLGLAVLLPRARRSLFQQWKLSRVALAFLLAYAPASLWITRNYLITGRFPLLSSIEGEALYGGNNEVVANDLTAWGYWIMPNYIPGETPKLELGKRMSSVELNDYYHRKGAAWIRGHLRELPRLILGKLIRGFVPVPFVPLLPSYVAFSYRFLLDALYVALWPLWWRSMNRTYLLFCLAMFTVQLATTVIFYGAYRFTHSFVEILFVPCILLGLQQWAARQPRTSSP